MITLEEATAEQLIQELMSRFDVASFVGHRRNTGTMQDETVGFDVGPPEFCEGLMLKHLRLLVMNAEQDEFDERIADDD